MRSPEVTQIAAVTRSTKKANGYGDVFAPIPVVQVEPLFKEKEIVTNVPHTVARAPIISYLKATEDLRSSAIKLGAFTTALTWWTSHEGGGKPILDSDGTTWALFHDVHNFFPESNVTLETPTTSEEWFLQMMFSKNQSVWLVAGHTAMELGNGFHHETVGIITKAQTRAYSKDDVIALQQKLGGKEEAVKKAGAGSLSLARDISFFDTEKPLEVWLYDDICDLTSGVQIASIPNWGALETKKLWNITNGIWPEVAACLTERFEPYASKGT